MTQIDLLIVGASAAGLVLAFWLTKLGRLIDKTAEPGTTSRALALQARSLELHRQLDYQLDYPAPSAARAIRLSPSTAASGLWVRGEPAARLAGKTVGGRADALTRSCASFQRTSTNARADRVIALARLCHGAACRTDRRRSAGGRHRLPVAHWRRR